MHRRDEIVVFFAILIIHEGLRPCLEDRLTSENTLSLEDTGSFEQIQSITKVTISKLCNEMQSSFLKEVDIWISFSNFFDIFYHEVYYFFRLDRFQDIRSTSRKESIDDGKARIFCRGSDEGDDSLLDPGKEDILL